MKVNMFGKQVELKTEAVVVIVSILILLGWLVGYIFLREDSEIIIETGAAAATTEGITEAALQSTQKENRTTGEAIALKDQIKIYVVGCVKEPGIVTLEKGQLIDDAVRKAGGLTEEAAADSINMVYELNENSMLYIKSKRELYPKKDTADKAAIQKNIESDSRLGNGVVIVKDSGGSAEVFGNGADKSGESANKGKASDVNINTAGAAELDTLPGVGEATARDIIAFREKNGPFGKIEDIMKVPRIKQNRFESVREFITVD